jgi:hypothetical protein
LRGFRLRGAKYQPLTTAADGSLLSRELGLRLVPEGAMLRLIDDRTGKSVPTRQERVEEEKQYRKLETQRADQEKQRADALAAELTRLKKQMNRRRKK